MPLPPTDPLMPLPPTDPTAGPNTAAIETALRHAPDDEADAARAAIGNMLNDAMEYAIRRMLQTPLDLIAEMSQAKAKETE